MGWQILIKRIPSSSVNHYHLHYTFLLSGGSASHCAIVSFKFQQVPIEVAGECIHIDKKCSMFFFYAFHPLNPEVSGVTVTWWECFKHLLKVSQILSPSTNSRCSWTLFLFFSLLSSLCSRSLHWIIAHPEQLVQNVDAAASLKGHWVTWKCSDCSFARWIRKWSNCMWGRLSCKTRRRRRRRNTCKVRANTCTHTLAHTHTLLKILSYCLQHQSLITDWLLPQPQGCYFA